MRSYLFGIIVQLQQVVADVGLEDRVPLFAGEGACQPLKGTNTVTNKAQLKRDAVAFLQSNQTLQIFPRLLFWKDVQRQTYPSQRLEQQAARSVRPFRQVPLQLVIVQRG